MDSRTLGFWIMIGFTFLWVHWPLGLYPVGTALAVLELIAAAVLIVLRLHRRRQRVTLATNPVGAADHAERRATNRIVSVAFCVEFLVIWGAVYLLRSMNVDLIQPAIAVIVGLHFLLFCLSPATRSVVHIITAAFGSVAGAAGMWQISTGADPATTHAAVGLCMGTITLTYAWIFLRVVPAVSRGETPVLR